MGIKIFTANIEEQALEQIRNIMKNPAFLGSKIRIMPDVHAGKGCVIGFTANFRDKIIPNIVGVDIGCGMLGINIGDIDVDLAELDQTIRTLIPAGREVHNEGLEKALELKPLLEKRPYLKDIDYLIRSIGTLGGGNHYIELDQASNGDKWLVIHSGSRNLGTQVANHYQELAIQNIKNKLVNRAEIINTLKSQGRQKEIQSVLENLKTPDFNKELAYIEGQDLEHYLIDQELAKQYAAANRMLIAKIIILTMGWDIKDVVETIHNYIEGDMVRKGAIDATENKRVLIPLNMRDGVILGNGLGNSDWNNSGPHGAGRVLSRKAAQEQISLEDYRESMVGIYSSSINESTIDESPMVYKPAEEIQELIKETVEIIDVMKPLYNFKASNSGDR